MLKQEMYVRLGNCLVQNEVEIGFRSYANDTMIRSHTTIGRYCCIGRRCTINAAVHPTEWLSHHPITYDSGVNPTALAFDTARPLTIGNDVWIGDNVVIMGGITIGDGAVIAAGAVVTKNVAPYAIQGGVPAKSLKQRFPDVIKEALLDLRWWNYEETLLHGLPYDDVAASVDLLQERIDSGMYAIMPKHHR